MQYILESLAASYASHVAIYVASDRTVHLWTDYQEQWQRDEVETAARSGTLKPQRYYVVMERNGVLIGEIIAAHEVQ